MCLLESWGPNLSLLNGLMSAPVALGSAVVCCRMVLVRVVGGATVVIGAWESVLLFGSVVEDAVAGSDALVVVDTVVGGCEEVERLGTVFVFVGSGFTPACLGGILVVVSFRIASAA